MADTAGSKHSKWGDIKAKREAAQLLKFADWRSEVAVIGDRVIYPLPGTVARAMCLVEAEILEIGTTFLVVRPIRASDGQTCLGSQAVKITEFKHVTLMKRNS